MDAFADGKNLFDQFGEKTVLAIKDGVRTLQAIWAGAWKAGKGDTIAAAKLIEADTDALKALYMRKTWMPSKTIRTIKPLLK